MFSVAIICIRIRSSDRYPFIHKETEQEHMKKYIFFLMGVVCFLLSSLAVHANELNKSDANIIGHVLDKSTKEHLSFISVSLKGTTIGTMTDASGHYFLKNLPEGEFTMEVSAVGYKTVSRKVT